MIAVILALAVAVCGTLWTYGYDARSPLSTRIAMGICSGFAVFATLCFGLACLLGLNAGSIGLAFLALTAPLWFTKSAWRNGWRRDWSNFQSSGASYSEFEPASSRRALWVSRAGMALLLGVLAWSFAGVSYLKPDGMYTAYETNIGDLTFHFQIITGFAWGENFPPQNPIYAGALFAYPFLPDFLTAIWLRCGAGFQLALAIQNLMLAYALAVLLQSVAWELVRDRLAALLTPFLVIFCGGLGWVMFIADASDSESGFWKLLSHLPRQYTNSDPAWRWSNSLTTLFITQRSLLLGLPLALTIFLLWRRFLVDDSTELAQKTKETRVEESSTSPGTTQTRDDARNLKRSEKSEFSARLRPLVAAGFFASTLPLIHSHTFLTVALCSFYFFALMIWPRSVWYRRDWARALGVFALAIAPLAILEIAYLLIARRSESNATPGAFLAWNFGWDKGADRNFFVFWLKNTGALWPLIFLAFWWNDDSRRALKRFAWFWAPLLLLTLVSSSSAIFAAPWLRALVGLWLACTPFVVAFCFLREKNRSAASASEESSTRWREFWRGAALFLSVFCTVGFVMPNLLRFAPWVWDNNKILIYWFVIAVPFAALALAHLWRGNSWKRALSVFLFFTMTWAGALDIWHGSNGQLEQRNFDNDGIALAQTMRALPPHSLILHAPTYNSPVCLSGQPSLMGYTGHVSSHGLESGPREAEIRDFLSGAPGSESVLKKYRVAAFIVGPQEIDYLKNLDPPLALASPAWWNKWKKAAQNGEYSLYTTR